MPLLPSRSRRSHDDFDSDNASDDSSTSSNPAHASTSRKRARLSNETTLTSPSPELPNGDGDPRLSTALQQETLRARSSRKKHQPGSIVRVKLSNFVTYTAVEFFPGPSLNMVIGPNGTGKSTLVCAICLGLGWETKHLGRAKDLGDFVKHGTREALIEIELAKDGVKFKSNIVIRCSIKREGNKSSFSVNGKPQNKKYVLNLARSLSIQIDNLCQFLPQDKVVEFAAMTPIELLHSTQRAVATQEMIDTHEQLKEFRKKQKEVQTKVDADQDTLNNLEGRQRLQEADVERMREREQVVKHVEMLELARPTVGYRMATDKFRAAKASRQDAQEELKDLQEEIEPALRAVNEKKGYKRQVEAVNQQRREAVKTSEGTADTIYSQFRASQDKSREIDHAIQAEKDAAKKKRSEISRIEGIVQQLKVELSHRPPDVDTAAYNEKCREKQRIWEKAETDIKEAQQQQRDITSRGRECNQRAVAAEERLNDLDSQAGKQKNKLHMLSQDTARLWDWVQQHPEAFEKPVFGPPVVECSIKDPKYVDMIEALFQRNILLSFTVQTRNDGATLSRIAHDRLNLAEVNFKTVVFELGHFKSLELEADEMRRYGFDSWAMGHISGPEPLLAMLCGEMKVHETAVALRDSTPQQFEAIKNSAVSNWVTPKATYRIARRKEYGPDATSTQSKSFRPARVWTDQPVDLTAKRELQEKISDAKEELAGYRTQLDEVKAKMSEWQDVYRTNKAEAKDLSEEKATKQKALADFKGLPTKIEGHETKLVSLREQLNGLSDQLHGFSEKQNDLAMDRARLAVKYSDAVASLRAAHQSLHEVELVLIEASSDLKILEDRNRSVVELLNSKRTQIDELNDVVKDSSNVAKRFLNKVQQLLRKDDQEEGPLRAFLQTLRPEQTVEELEEDIQSERARLELMHEGNGNTIREFETRQKKIEALTAQLTEENHAFAELSMHIDQLRSQWEPELDRLVKRISDSFSYNMEQISCVGEVAVGKEEDFDEWSILIRVKFRENEPLSTLNSHRQSGGERAVSTIFYLMSLQSLTPSPFRVVDEINQGMDPRNERLVHKRMVDIACGITPVGPHSSSDEDDEGGEHQGSQYFLITPKLLQDLEYARGMQVLCIASGEYMEQYQETKVDFRSCVDRRKSLMGVGGTGVGRVGVAAG
ncbi:uncharacterized protein KY384_006348 [Bacidia gigantensis]|uniref:uncharacterized protein n=1 Tax=Bacidia gigantensis TaxID=2732470 RepID=UPI001D03690E|nr:uncharacterized protein KY384_006348 [Bacidia gigantensis]KAG8528661.1 hypothetical protein KY384_006348 [Bacidia gigantensis]